MTPIGLIKPKAFIRVSYIDLKRYLKINESKLGTSCSSTPATGYLLGCQKISLQAPVSFRCKSVHSGKQSHFFCAVIEPHVSHSCASELSTGLSLQQWQAASCKLHDSVCATLLKPAPLGMRIDSLRKSFIKMPCLPTVQVPAGCKRTFNAVAMPIANCRGPGPAAATAAAAQTTRRLLVAQTVAGCGYLHR